MTSQAVTAKGQVTLKRDLLQHLGIKPGERVELEKMPGGELRLRAARSTGTIDSFLGVLAGKSRKIATLEEINEAEITVDTTTGSIWPTSQSQSGNRQRGDEPARCRCRIGTPGGRR